MNKYFLAFGILLLFNFCNNTQIGKIIKFSEPIREGGMHYMKHFNNRKSSRDFDDSTKIPIEILSQTI